MEIESAKHTSAGVGRTVEWRSEDRNGTRDRRSIRAQDCRSQAMNGAKSEASCVRAHGYRHAREAR
jgi:hypothetical protein